MLDCVAAVACVIMGLEATEDRKAAVREMIKQVSNCKFQIKFSGIVGQQL